MRLTEEDKEHARRLVDFMKLVYAFNPWFDRTVMTRQVMDLDGAQLFLFSYLHLHGGTE